MQLIIPGLTTGHLYVEPSNFYLTRCLVRFIAGASIVQGNALAYWVKPIIVTPLCTLDGELVAMPDEFQCKLQSTLIKLPADTRGLNIYIPKGSAANIYGEISPVSSQPQYLEV
jgi:hypothetical protein